MRSISKLGLLLFLLLPATGQDFPYVFQRFAGNPNIGDGGPATEALLQAPADVEVDRDGNVYILDALNKRIRKMDTNGTISTLVQLQFEGYDMARTVDGTFYVTAKAQIWKVAPNGAVTSIAGNGIHGFSPDGTLAVNAQIDFTTNSVTLDSSGLIYYIEYARIRRIRADGTLETIAGVSQTGNVDGPVAAARFSTIGGLAFDAAGTLYIADGGNRRIRKIQNGVVSTIAGGPGGTFTVSGPAKTSPIGSPWGLVCDAAGNLFFRDTESNVIYKLANDTVTVVAGTRTLGYSDGPILSAYLGAGGNLTMDQTGAFYVPESDLHRVRKIAAGNTTTIAGRLHSGGDGGAATSALLNLPEGTALGAQGSVLILDKKNNRIRRVASNGTITTAAGTGLPNLAFDNGVSIPPQVVDGLTATNIRLAEVSAMASDRQGNFYLGVNDPLKRGSLILRVNSAGIVTTFAGTGVYSSTGDGGPATAATFSFITVLSVDNSGSVYLVDNLYRVRKIDPNGIVTAFAGTGVAGFSGDGGLATLAKLDFVSDLVVDGQGNVYITGDRRVRRVTPNGIINTFIGNGTDWTPTDGVKVTGGAFENQSGLTFDTAGNLFLLGSKNLRIYKMDPNGIIRTIAGGGTVPIADGLLGISSKGTLFWDIDVDSNGDLYVTDQPANIVWKLVQNSPTGISLLSGNNQTGPSGIDLPVPLKVQLTGRAAAPPEGVTVNFAVTSGSATLSSATAKTDASGAAFIRVRPGAAGPITITATVPGTTLPPVPVSLTGQPALVCALAVPAISDVHSLSEWGNFTRFASGSYLEIKGSNLAQGTRLWGGADFQGSNAPIVMDGASVLINGKPAFTYYISPGQLNVQAPGDAAIGNVQITVSNCGGTSAPFTMQKAAIAPGLLAPGSFNVGGKQYLVALFPGGQTFVGRPNLIAGASFREAKPGDSITAYGIGFGDTTPANSPGVITAEKNSIPGLTIAFGSTSAVVSYSGLAPGTVGLYQFDFTVPDVADGDQEIVVKVGATQVLQTLFLTVKR